jgi:hypothetical protein
MQDVKKRGQLDPSAAVSGGDSAKKATDVASDKLRKTASQIGNEEIQQRIQKGNASRDDLLRFITERMRTMRDVQMQEVALSDKRSMRENWRTISDRQKGVDAPDPTRWREVARKYEEAAAQICRGALGRGAQLVDEALDAEKHTVDSLTELIDSTDLEQHVEAERGAGSAVPPDAACGSMSIPGEIKDLSDKIQRVTEKPEEVPGRRRVADPWWTEEEEEEEEDEGGGG